MSTQDDDALIDAILKATKAAQSTFFSTRQPSSNTSIRSILRTPTPTPSPLPLRSSEMKVPLKIPVRSTGVKLPLVIKRIPLKNLFKQNAERIDEILTTPLTISEARVVPAVNDVGFTEGKRLETAVLFIDMRGSTSLSQERYKETISKIYKAFFDGVGKVVSWKSGAYIRGFAGDRLMAVFAPGDNACNWAVDAAIIMQTVITKILNPKLKQKYGAVINYGIGIDYGEMMVVRAGIKGGGSNNDLVWAGNTANYASKLADVNGRSGIRITETVYKKLTKHKVSSSGINLWPYKGSAKVGNIDLPYYRDACIYNTTINEVKI